MGLAIAGSSGRDALAVDGRFDALAESREAFEGHDVDRFVELDDEAEEVARPQRSHGNDSAFKGLLEIGAADTLADAEGRAAGDGKHAGGGVPVAEAVKTGNHFKGLGVRYGAASLEL